MRLIAVVADTHVPGRASAVPPDLLQELEQREPYKIFHAGDLTAEDVIDDLEFVAPVQAVKGNNDTELDLPGEYEETFEETTVAMRHRPDTADLDRFADRLAADIVIHGHTHTASVVRQDGIDIVNPGSPTVPRGQPSYALISIRGRQSEIEICYL
jgi:putative phosphoesterase